MRPASIGISPCKSQEAYGFIHEVHPPIICPLHGAPCLMVCYLAALVLTAATTGCLPAFFCFRRADLANDGIGCIFAHHIRGMDHIKLGSRILASKRENCQLAPRVLRQEACDVEHPAVQDDPAVLLRCVLGHLFNSVSTTTCVLLFLRLLI